MAVIGDLVKDNPYYKDYPFYGTDYKKHIPQSRFAEQITPQDLQKALIQQSFIEVAKKIMLVAFVAIPSIYTLGGIAVGSAVVTAVICAVGSVEIEGSALNIIKATQLKGNLLAALPKSQRYIDIFINQLGFDAAIKTSFMSVVLLAPARTASIFANIGVFVSVYSLTKEVEKLLLLCIEIYAIKNAQQAYDNLQPTGAS